MIESGSPVIQNGDLRNESGNSINRSGIMSKGASGLRSRVLAETTNAARDSQGHTS